MPYYSTFTLNIERRDYHQNPVKKLASHKLFNLIERASSACLPSFSTSCSTANIISLSITPCIRATCPRHIIAPLGIGTPAYTNQLPTFFLNPFRIIHIECGKHQVIEIPFTHRPSQACTVLLFICNVRNSNLLILPATVNFWYLHAHVKISVTTIPVPLTTMKHLIG